MERDNRGTISIRTARVEDIPALVAMRWEFSFEEAPDRTADRDTFAGACGAFLQEAITGDEWVVWLSENALGQIVAHIYVCLVPKVPRPWRYDGRLGYVTNVYVAPAYRNAGIGSTLLRTVIAWAKEAGLELLILWPSTASVPYYRRAGFTPSPEAMELELHPY